MTFQSRLKKCMRDGNLMVADLARYFERPYPTVRNWIFNGAGISGGPDDILAVEKALLRLERLIDKHKMFPVPRLSPRKRITYLKTIQP